MFNFECLIIDVYRSFFISCFCHKTYDNCSSTILVLSWFRKIESPDSRGARIADSVLSYISYNRRFLPAPRFTLHQSQFSRIAGPESCRFGISGIALRANAGFDPRIAAACLVYVTSSVLLGRYAGKRVEIQSRGASNTRGFVFTGIFAPYVTMPRVKVCHVMIFCECNRLL